MLLDKNTDYTDIITKDKELQRLRDLRELLLLNVAATTLATAALAEDDYYFIMDNLAAWYSSLDNVDADTMDKELQRLRDLNELILSKIAATPLTAAALAENQYNFVMDNLLAWYLSLDNSDCTDTGMRDKELWRLRDLK